MSPKDTPHTPPLARASHDRAADERLMPDLVATLRKDSASRVLVVWGDQAPLAPTGSLAFVAPDAVRGEAAWAFLGRDAGGAALLVAAFDADAEAPAPTPEWGALRAVGGDLPPEEASVFVNALALGRWLLDSRYCPRCGGITELRAAGWSRRCTVCGREHFPRTDPAVIVAVTDASGDRLLLGKNARWAQRNVYSAFAGFVEAGESLESAIVREIAEESGVVVRGIRYRGSQAWPYPRSLMLGFHAVADDPDAARADGEEIVDVRWFTRAELRAAFDGAGDVQLPGAASIAHRLIRDWIDADEDRP